MKQPTKKTMEELNLQIEKDCHIKLIYETAFGNPEELTQILIKCEDVCEGYKPYASIALAIDKIDVDKLGYWIKETYYAGDYAMESYNVPELQIDEFIDLEMIE